MTRHEVGETPLQQVTIPEKGNQKEVTAEIFMAEVFNVAVVYEGVDNERMEEETQNTHTHTHTQKHHTKIENIM